MEISPKTEGYETNVAGVYERSPESKKDIRFFIERFNINMDQFEPSDPDAYAALNEFFIRKYKDGARPLTAPDDESVIVSPAESRMVAYDSAELTQKF